VLLPQPESVRVPGWEVADVQGDPGEPRDLSHLSLREEPVGDPALVEDLDGACMQSSGARAREVLADARLDDGDVDPCQRQLARQHQPGRTASGDHHRVLDHRHLRTPNPSVRALRPASMRPDPGLAASPPVRSIMVVEGERVLSFQGCPSVANLRPGIEPRGRERPTANMTAAKGASLRPGRSSSPRTAHPRSPAGPGSNGPSGSRRAQVTPARRGASSTGSGACHTASMLLPCRSFTNAA
jgi:hypothetical protein